MNFYENVLGKKIFKKYFYFVDNHPIPFFRKDRWWWHSKMQFTLSTKKRSFGGYTVHSKIL